jgi:hypothetical protein
MKQASPAPQEGTGPILLPAETEASDQELAMEGWRFERTDWQGRKCYRHQTTKRIGQRKQDSSQSSKDKPQPAAVRA